MLFSWGKQVCNPSAQMIPGIGLQPVHFYFESIKQAQSFYKKSLKTLFLQEMSMLVFS